MNSFAEMWNQLAWQRKTAIAIGAALILALAVGIGLWAYRTDYQVLFADVPPADAAAMTAELDKLKVPYQLADGGHTILVPKDLVYKTRLKLMGKDLPLHGAVGFEVFNNADFGMTEFVQKVNYQRAIQGELTRTILSIEDVQAARVHLAIPEQGLFKKSVTKSKASVTVTMKPGRVLAPEQIIGIQRLVAASVPEIVAEDVTVLDQHGVALTRTADAASGNAAAGSHLDSKRGAEEYLLRKVSQVLDRTFGQGQAIATVDVQLNLDQSRVTTEEVLPAKSANQEGNPAGVVVRERQTTRDTSGPVGTGTASQAASSGTVTSIESDYQVGRRVEQVVTAAGSIRRMTVAVVVKKPLTDEQLERLREVIASAVGSNAQRGDTVVVHSMEKLATSANEVAVLPMPGGSQVATPNGKVETAAVNDSAKQFGKFVLWSVFAAVSVILALVLLGRRTAGQAARRLSDSDREKMLGEVRQWILQAPAPEKMPGGQA